LEQEVAAMQLLYAIFMKSLIVASLAFILLTAFDYQSRRTETAALTCTLKSDKIKYRVGELPKFKVEIANNTGKDIYLLGSLDGSDIKWRMPYCYFSIEKPIPDTLRFVRCGNMNTLKSHDFKLVKAGAKFDPYERVGDYGFFTDFIITNSQSFKKAGFDKGKFHYSTNSQNIDDFMGDRPFQQDKVKAQKLEALLRQMPKVEIVSNEIELSFEN
jgi:hypothetical protein